MNTLPFFHAVLTVMTVLAVVVWCALFFIDAGYGQYIDRRWGAAVNNKLGWVIMETPVVVIFAAYWLTSTRTCAPTPLVFFLLFNLHYLQRALVFPFLIRGADLMPWSVILLGMLFNVANAYMQGAWIFCLSPPTLYTSRWLHTPQFLIGVTIFLAGFVINLHSDHIIRTLRPPGDTAFHIPHGGLFEHVTAANYFGEFTEWVGWAILTLSWPGLVFALWTFANLGPRAYRHHEWYKHTFGDAYPSGRRRMIPYLY